MFTANLKYVYNILCISTTLLVASCSTGEEPIASIKAKALLATEFKTLEDFATKVELHYSDTTSDSITGTVRISYKDHNQLIVSELSNGVTQGDIVTAHVGDIWDKLSLLFSSPYAVWNRKELSQIYMLARRRPLIFGDGDIAFYDLALASMRNIRDTNGAFSNFRDSLEKGYINTFNHITAQALITTLHDEEIADYIATVHERFSMPQLVSGKFSSAQLSDTLDFPVDNYIDIINNEIGQELGKYLKSECAINDATTWTPSLTAKYLNKVQDYYAYSFDLEIDPFSERDSLIVRFADKIETIKKGKSYLYSKSH